MALTPVVVTRRSATAKLQVPRPLLSAAVAVDTTDTKGLFLSMIQDQGPAAQVEVTGDADWFWSGTDLLAVANMKKVLANVPEVIQVSPGSTGVTMYIKTAATANIMPTIRQ
jgi:hypothetical protein